MIEIGKTYTFDYPPQFISLPEYTQARLCPVKVLGLHEDSQDDPETEPLYRIQDEYGWIGCAFESELV